MSLSNNRLNDIPEEEKKKLTLTQKMKLVFPELANMNKIPMAVKSHYLGTRAQVRSGEKELTWTGLTLHELEDMTDRLRARGRAQYAKIKESGGTPFGAPSGESQTKEPSKKRKKRESVPVKTAISQGRTEPSTTTEAKKTRKRRKVAPKESATENPDLAEEYLAFLKNRAKLASIQEETSAHHVQSDSESDSSNSTESD